VLAVYKQASGRRPTLLPARMNRPCWPLKLTGSSRRPTCGDHGRHPAHPRWHDPRPQDRHCQV